MVGCGMDKNDDKNIGEVDRTVFSNEVVQSEIIKGLHIFGVGILHELLNEKENQIISPYSISAALSMILAGADGETRKEIKETLAFSQVKEEEVHESHEALWIVLKGLDTDITFEVANSIWMDGNTNFRTPFIDVLKNSYDASAHKLSTPKAINDWVSNKTNRTIKEMVDEIDLDAILYILNAIYFNGSWSVPFDEGFTSNEEFYIGDSSETVTTSLMTKRDELYYHKTEKYELVRLPYGNERLFMDVLLPKEGESVSKILEVLKSGEMEWKVPIEKQSGIIALPKFSIEYDMSLNEVLKEMGMPSAFDPKLADFSNIAEIPPNIFINEVKHKTYIEVDEKGTEASAATSVEITRGSAPKEDFQMTINRPFLFRIIEDKTGAVIFIGHVSNPSL
ncbi:serpin B [Evansella vedderi]|uniref:Serpin B n=1 Tax=Evansella vedderi TaxID=38282 RepID=A0ABT9ZZF9_9BACI|nr:serpin family protein [Evansella vedderi]MDQ0255833.1 serpin B [Evansella vedderi]